MKIAANHSDKRFRDISKGGVFQFNGDYFIRIHNNGAVHLETGTIHTFSNGAHVVAMPNAVLTFKEQLR